MRYQNEKRNPRNGLNIRVYHYQIRGRDPSSVTLHTTSRSKLKQILLVCINFYRMRHRFGFCDVLHIWIFHLKQMLIWKQIKCGIFRRIAFRGRLASEHQPSMKGFLKIESLMNSESRGPCYVFYMGLLSLRSIRWNRNVYF